MAEGSPITTSALEELRARLPEGMVRVDEAARLTASLDNARLSFLPEAVIAPTEETHVGEVLHLANAHGVPVTVRGGGTATTGAASPVRGGWVLDLGGWQELQIDAAAGFAYAQPGVRIAQLQAAAEAEGRFYPPDPSSQKYCTVGGTIACNAGGMRGAKYGVTRDYVAALEGFLPTGEWVRWGADLRKYASGYNLRDLWIGSEGTLGVITGAVLKLLPKPAARATALAAFSDEATALAAVRSLLETGLVPAILEFLDRQTVTCVRRFWATRNLGEEALAGQVLLSGLGEDPALLLLEVDGAQSRVAEEMDTVRRWSKTNGAALFHEASDAAEREALWAVRRTGSQAMFQLGPDKLNEDVVVPLRAQSELLAFVGALRETSGLPTPTFGHAADGNFHVHLMFDREDKSQAVRAEQAVQALMERVVALGGAITGEHGIGLAKTPFLRLQHSEAEIRAMQAVKQALDPRGILNPGKLFEPFEVWKETPVKVRLPWDH